MLLDYHRARPSLVLGILWCLCSLGANCPENLSKMLSWNSVLEQGKWGILILLQALYKSRSQTNEAREHAELLLGWLEKASITKQVGDKQPILSQGLVEPVNIGDSMIELVRNKYTSYRTLSLKESENSNSYVPRVYEDYVAPFPVIYNMNPQVVVWSSGQPGTQSKDIIIL